MAQHYSPKAFMIEAPNSLLKEYYERQGLNGDIPWKHLSERDIGRVFGAYHGVRLHSRGRPGPLAHRRGRYRRYFF